ncbi:MAG: TlpA disulfide reductase family protein [Eubacteriales bacterium]|nr:TlpA disulfide reductase family protein [Eubacteriales bacterium]
MKKALVSILLMLSLLFPCALAESADYGDPHYQFQFPTLCTDLYVSPAWEEYLITTDNIISIQDYDSVEQARADGASSIFYYAENARGLFEAEGLERIIEVGIPLAGVVLYPAGKTAQEYSPEGFAHRDVHTNEKFSIAIVWSTEPDFPEDLPADTRETLELIIASYRDTDLYYRVTPPILGLGVFETTDVYGEPVSHADVFDGAKLTVVNAWATFCQPCLKEMPYLGELAEEYADKGVQFIGIPTDIMMVTDNTVIDEEYLELALRYIESTGADAYTHLIPDAVINEDLLDAVIYVPSTWFFDEHGNLISDTITGAYSKEQWAAMIEEYLAIAQGE